MEYFKNYEAGKAIEDYLSSLGCNYGKNGKVWKEKELKLHQAIEELADDFGDCAPGCFKAIALPDVLEEALTREESYGWEKSDLAAAFYLEAVDLYKGNCIQEFKASLKSALFGISAGLDEKERKKIHLLKLADKYWGDVSFGAKTFEVRYNDRHFKAGDQVRFCRVNNRYDEMGAEFVITFVLTHDDFPEGVPDGWCVFSLARIG